MNDKVSLYERDFYAWTQEQAGLIRNRSLQNLDLRHLQEELENMGAREKRELGSRLTILLMHLLKWKYQNSRQCKSWLRTIKEQRIEVNEVINDNPSLYYNLSDNVKVAYRKAVLKAANENNLDEEAFPSNCEWTIEKILNEDFYPN